MGNIKDIHRLWNLETWWTAARFMYKVKNEMRPDCIEKSFKMRVIRYEHRGICKLTKRLEQMKKCKPKDAVKEFICGRVLK